MAIIVILNTKKILFYKMFNPNQKEKQVISISIKKNNKNEDAKKNIQEEGQKGKEAKINDNSEIIMNKEVSTIIKAKKENENPEHAGIPNNNNLSPKNSNNSEKSKPLWRRILEVISLIFSSLLSLITFINFLFFIF